MSGVRHFTDPCFDMFLTDFMPNTVFEISRIIRPAVYLPYFALDKHWPTNGPWMYFPFISMIIIACLITCCYTIERFLIETDFKSYDQLFDEQCFRSEQYQRPFKYLQTHDMRGRRSPTQFDQNNKLQCLKTLLRYKCCQSKGKVCYSRF